MELSGDTALTGSGAILRDTRPERLALAVEANIAAHVAYLGRWPRIEVQQGQDGVWAVSDLRSTLFNQVALARFGTAGIDARIEAILGLYARRRVDGFWWIGPGSRPADLRERLQARGIGFGGSPGMAADLSTVAFDQPLPEGVRVQLVEDLAGLERWVQVIADAWQLATDFVPIYLDFCANQALGRDARWRVYVAHLEGTPVGTSSVFYGAGVAGLYQVTVAPAARQRGIGTALTLAPLRDALAAGYRVATLIATRVANTLYRRLGFAEYCRIGQGVFMHDAGGRRLKTSLLYQGMTGKDVVVLQQDLRRLGYDPGPVDGHFGPATEAAVRAFQQAHGGSVDGVVGPQTHRALEAALGALASGQAGAAGGERT